MKIIDYKLPRTGRIIGEAKRPMGNYYIVVWHLNYQKWLSKNSVKTCKFKKEKRYEILDH